MYGAVDIDTGALILTVDAEGLQEFVKLLQLPSATTVQLDLAHERAATRPVGTLSLEPTGDDGVNIVVEGDVATMTGSSDGFARLAREVRQFGDYNDLSEPGMHAHFDAAADVLGPGSASLIVAGPVSD